MRRAVAMLVLVAACGGGVTDTTDSGGVETTTTSASTATTSGEPTTTSPAGDTTTTADSGREQAPDFTLALGDGGTYTLSAAAKPVYLVFWAEW